MIVDLLTIGAVSTFLGLLIFWGQRDRREVSRLRAAREREARRVGPINETLATVGDLSEGTLSRAHALQIAYWVHDIYHTPYCALLDGYNACTCGGVPSKHGAPRPLPHGGDL